MTVTVSYFRAKPAVAGGTMTFVDTGCDWLNSYNVSRLFWRFGFKTFLKLSLFQFCFSLISIVRTVYTWIPKQLHETNNFQFRYCIAVSTLCLKVIGMHSSVGEFLTSDFVTIGTVGSHDSVQLTAWLGLTQRDIGSQNTRQQHCGGELNVCLSCLYSEQLMLSGVTQKKPRSSFRLLSRCCGCINDIQCIGVKSADKRETRPIQNLGWGTPIQSSPQSDRIVV